MKKNLFKKSVALLLAWVLMFSVSVTLSADALVPFGGEDMNVPEPVLTEIFGELSDVIGYIPAHTDEVISQAEDGTKYVENTLILFFDPEVSIEEALSLIADNGCVVTGVNRLLGMYTVRAEAEDFEELQAKAEQLRNLPQVSGAETNKVFTTSLYVPNDPWAGDVTYSAAGWDSTVSAKSNWHMRAIGAAEAWEMMEYDTNSPYESAVGVIDSGINLSHEEFNGGGVTVTLVSSGGYNSQLSNHGSHVSGTIAAAADNNKGVTGILQKGDLYFASAGIDATQLDNAKILDGLSRTVESGAKAINCSFGAPGGTGGGGDSSLALAMATLISEGYDFLIVQAAGNDSGLDASGAGAFVFSEEVANTAAAKKGLSGRELLDRVIIVASVSNDYNTTNGYKLSYFSNVGNRVDIAAPGGNAVASAGNGVYSTNFNGYGYSSGTSMAAPHVTGVAGLIKAKFPDLSAKDIKEILCHPQATGNACAYYPADTTEYRMLDAVKALNYAAAYDERNSLNKDLVIRSDVQNVFDPATVEYTGSTMTIKTNGDYRISMRVPDSSTGDKIVVESGVKATVTFSGLSLTAAPDFSGARVALNLAGENVVTGSEALNAGYLTVTGAVGGKLQAPSIQASSYLEIKSGAIITSSLLCPEIDMYGGAVQAAQFGSGSTSLTVEDGSITTDMLTCNVLLIAGGDINAYKVNVGNGYMYMTNGFLSSYGGISVAGRIDIIGGAVVAFNPEGPAIYSGTMTVLLKGTVIAGDGGITGGPVIGNETFVFATVVQGRSASEFPYIFLPDGVTINKTAKTLTLHVNLYVPTNNLLIIPPGWTLDVNSKTLTNDGQIANYGTIIGNVQGSGGAVYGDFSLRSASLDVYSPNVASYVNNTLTIKQGGAITVTMRSGVTETLKDVIVVGSGVTGLDLTLQNVKIRTDKTALTTGANTSVTIFTSGTNSLIGERVNAGGVIVGGGTSSITFDGTGSLYAKGGENMPGIGCQVNDFWSRTLIFNGGGIEAAGGKYGAGIGRGLGNGGNYFGDKTRIEINGGNITATGGKGAAGIGGGYNSISADTTINGGNVVTIGGEQGAGIGSGAKTPNTIYLQTGTVKITGGTIDATGSGEGPGIGNGVLSKPEHIIITGGDVTASGGGTSSIRGAAGIGGNTKPSGILILVHDNVGLIEISGGTVNATGSRYGAGIGAGDSGDGGDIRISGGNITATGGEGAAGIGSGRYPSNTSYNTKISISGGTVNAAGNIAPGIGGGGSTVTVLGGSGAGNIIIDISGGNVTATGGVNRPGISRAIADKNGKMILTVTGGTLTANSGGVHPAIGGSLTDPGNYDEAHLIGGVVYANGGTNSDIGQWNPSAVLVGTGPLAGEINGNVVVFADRIDPNIDITRGIVFQNTVGTFYGPHVMVTEDVTFPSDHTLTIEDGKTLSVKDGKTLTNDGTISFGTIGQLRAFVYEGSKESAPIWSVPGFGDLINCGAITGDYQSAITMPTHTVSFDYAENGGDSATAVSAVYEEGEFIDLSPIAEKTGTYGGWEFVGWNTDKNATAGLSLLRMEDRDVTLYAIYKKILAVTVIGYDGAEKVTSTAETAIYNNATSGVITFPELPLYPGWTGLLWTTSTSVGVLYGMEPGDRLSMSEEYMNNYPQYLTYYGMYQRNITLSYDANGGDSTPPSQSGVQKINSYNVSATLSPYLMLAPAITKEGYRFLGWAEGSPTGTRRNAGSMMTVYSNMTMYAVWEADIRITSAQPAGMQASLVGQSLVLRFNVTVEAIAGKYIRIDSFTRTFSYDGEDNAIPVGSTSGSSFQFNFLIPSNGLINGVPIVSGTGTDCIATIPLHLFVNGSLNLVTASTGEHTVDPVKDILDTQRSYNIIADNAFQNLKGEELTGSAAGLKAHFFSKSYYKPTVASIVPANNAAGVTAGGNITVTFSKQMDKKTAGTVTLNPGGITLSGGTWSPDGRTYAAAYSGLITGLEYSVGISGFADPDGNVMSANNANKFTVEGQLPVYTLIYDANAGGDQVTGIIAPAQYTYGQQVTIAGKLTRSGYEFTQWNTEANGSGTAYNAEDVCENLSSVNGGEVTLYAMWEEALYVVPELTPMAGSTTVIDHERKFIYGLKLVVTESDLRNTFLDVDGDGYFIVQPGTLGTGAKVTLYSNYDPNFSEEYWLVIFGDVTGDGLVTASDVSEIKRFIADNESVPNLDNRSSPFFFAADLYQNGVVNQSVASIVNQIALGARGIDQQTGLLI